MSNINKLNILGTEVDIPSFENKQTLDGFSETEEGKLLWNNEPIEGSGKDLPNNITYFDDTEEEVEIPIIQDNVTKIINNHVYSTKERIVGEWIDKKPIYEKSIEFTIDKHYSGDHVWTDPIPNFDVMIDIKGTMRIPSGRFFNLPHVSINNNYGVNMVANADGSIILDTGSEDRTNSVVRITIQYTKTTDTSSLAEAALEEE